MNRIGRVVGGLLAALALSACSHKDRMAPVVAAYSGGRYDLAAEAMTPLLADRQDSDKDRTLYELEAGAVFAAAGDDARSTAAFAAADERMWPYLDESAETRISAIAAAILTNQTVIPYVGRPYDRIMGCAYLGLNHLAQGDLEAAGVAFRRAYEWQRDAVAKYEDEIEAMQREAGAKSEKDSYDSAAAMQDAQFQSGLSSAYGALEDLSGYADFAIPYATLLEAIQQSATGRNDDLPQALYNFRRAAEMLPEAERADLAADAARIEAAIAGAPIGPHVHVIVEAGMAPRLDEFKISIPLFMRQYPYFGASFPVMKFNEGAASGFTARAGGAGHPSTTVTDMDRVVAGDFKARLPAIIALTLVSTATKMIATYAAQQAAMNSGDNNAAWVIAIGMMTYQMGTNSADLRTWLTLPKRVLYASFPAPADGQLSIDLPDGRTIGPIATESDGLTIVHVRSPGPAAEPAVRTMRFPVR
ncbi:MAG: hypothetical protein RI967_1858 [Planctomycetota bacterium]